MVFNGYLMFITIIQVTNKVYVVYFTKRNLVNTNTFSITTSPPKKRRSLMTVNFFFFEFQYCQMLKFL